MLPKSAYPVLCGTLFVAGQVAAPAAAAEESARVIEEVIVTARYREETVQDTPIAVTAFNESMLEAITAQDLRDVGPQSPNVRVQANTFAPNSSTIHIRGMGSLTIESTNELRNGVSLNGVYISRPVATLIDFFDMDTVEVLRGPQGTTFGKNSLSGAVAMNTIRPDGTFDYKAELTGGNYDRLDFRGAVQFPILGDTLSARISYLGQNYDGHYKNRATGGRLNGEDVDSVRGTVVWSPTETFEATLIYQWLKERSQAPGGDERSDPNQLINFAFAGPPFFWDGEPDDGDFTVGRDALDMYNTDQDGVTGIMEWDIGNLTLTSITGWIATDDFAAADFDQTELPFFPTFRDQEHDQFSQELRLTSDFTGMSSALRNLDLVLGLFYFEQEHEIVQTFPTLNNSADYAHQDGDSRAVFGQAIYALTSDLNVFFGARYTKENKDFERNPGTPIATPINYLDPATRPSIEQMAALPRSVTGDLDSDRTTIKLGADYHFTDTLMGYASYSTGYKAGEFGARAGSNLTAGPTDDETSDAYEVGIKSEFMDGRLRVNASAFYTNYEDLAFEVFFPNPNNPTGQETASQNIGEATVTGLELEVTAVPIDGLTLQGVLGLLDAEYDDFCADLDGPAPESNPVSDCGGQVTLLPDGTYLLDIDHTDLELSRAPDTQVYLSAQYDWNTDIGALFVRGAGSYESTYFSDGAINHPNGETGDFWLLDASAGWSSLDDRWRVQAWCKNCSDKHYTAGLTPTAQFFNQHFWGLPRTYGLTLTVYK